MSESARAAVTPDFEIFWKLEIMRMISFFLPDFRLSAVGSPELRIAAHAQPMPMATACLHFEVEDCDPMRTASAHRFSRIVDYETMPAVSSYLCRASTNWC